MPAPGQNINEIRTKFMGAFPSLVAGLNELQELVNNIVRWIKAQPQNGGAQAAGTALILATHTNGTRTTVSVLTSTAPAVNAAAGPNAPVNPGDL